MTKPSAGDAFRKAKKKSVDEADERRRRKEEARYKENLETIDKWLVKIAKQLPQDLDAITQAVEQDKTYKNPYYPCSMYSSEVSEKDIMSLPGYKLFDEVCKKADVLFSGGVHMSSYSYDGIEVDTRSLSFSVDPDKPYVPQAEQKNKKQWTEALKDFGR